MNTAARSQQIFPDFSGKFIYGGAYRLDEIIGYGSSAIIYTALDGTGELFACKCIYIKASENEAGLHSACSLASKRVVKVHRIIHDERWGYTFIIMDFCGSFGLPEQIAYKFCDTQLRDNSEDIRDIFLQILEAVEDCHNIGVFHCDLKPANILFERGVGGRKNAFLADFGRATTETSVRIDSGYRSLSDICSNAFLAPELLEDDGYYVPRYVDIWALGMLLFYICCETYMPWKEAAEYDPGFAYFSAVDQDYLLQYFPISPQLNCLLKKISVLEPTKRPSISEMKIEVRNMKSFFSSVDGGGHMLNLDVILKYGYAGTWNRSRIESQPVYRGYLHAIKYGEDLDKLFSLFEKLQAVDDYADERARTGTSVFGQFLIEDSAQTVFSGSETLVDYARD